MKWLRWLCLTFQDPIDVNIDVLCQLFLDQYEACEGSSPPKLKLSPDWFSISKLRNTPQTAIVSLRNFHERYKFQSQLEGSLRLQAYTAHVRSDRSMAS